MIDNNIISDLIKIKKSLTDEQKKLVSDFLLKIMEKCDDLSKNDKEENKKFYKYNYEALNIAYKYINKKDNNLSDDYPIIVIT